MDGIWYDRLARNEGKADALGERGKQQMALHHGEVQAEADARTGAEWQVRVTGELFLPFRSEALRIKFFRFWEGIIRVPTHNQFNINMLKIGTGFTYTLHTF